MVHKVRVVVRSYAQHCPCPCVWKNQFELAIFGQTVKKPGLMRQHLTCVRAANEICQARVNGDELGSSDIEFYPGEIQEKLAVATSARIPQHVCERELRQVQKKCNWMEYELEKCLVEACGPGNFLSLRINSRRVKEVFDVVGKVGTSAERVANMAIREMQRYLTSHAVVADKLADQLLLPMVLGCGGRYRTLQPSLHTLSNIEVIQSFLDCQIEVKKIGDDDYEVIVAN